MSDLKNSALVEEWRKEAASSGHDWAWQRGRLFSVGDRMAAALTEQGALRAKDALVLGEHWLADEAQKKTIDAQAKEIAHWKANHADMVLRCALLRERPDLPVDRIPAYEKLVELQGVREHCAQIAERAPGQDWSGDGTTAEMALFIAETIRESKFGR